MMHRNPYNQFDTLYQYGRIHQWESFCTFTNLLSLLNIIYIHIYIYIYIYIYICIYVSYIYIYIVILKKIIFFRNVSDNGTVKKTSFLIFSLYANNILNGIISIIN